MVPKEMSWLSPKRRRTTGNLKSIPNGQVSTESTSATGSPKTPTIERPDTSPTQPRPVSQPLVETALPGPDGNLFYAYARRGDDLKSRYLLTFASANVANEWWLLLQAHFPDASRPGPQLFSFKDPELLSKAWKHPSFSHLKTKWMYISFSDTQENGLGGAAQGIIPVQDEHGNMLGGSAPASQELLGQVGQVRREAKNVRNEITKLEEYFEKMMDAIEKNTTQVAHLADQQQNQRSVDFTDRREDSVAGGYFDMSELSSHLGRINDLLARNSEHVEGLATRQFENDQKLRSTLQDLNSRQKNDYLDMAQLSSHLDRIQSVVEESVKDRRDSAKELAALQTQTKLDLSPLTDGLEKVREAVEQNSELIRALLEEGTAPESKPGTPFWGKDAPAQADLSPLTEHLQKIHAAIEQQSSHMQALVSFAGGDEEAAGGPVNGSSGDTAEKSLAPLGEHLEQIYNAIEEGNNHARQLPRLDLQPLTQKFDGLTEHMSAVQTSSRKSTDYMQQILHAHEDLRTAVINGNKLADFAPVTEKLDGLGEHLESLREWVEYSSEQLKEFLDAQKAASDESKAGSTLNVDPVTDMLEKVLESQNATRSAVEAGRSLDLAPLTDRFDVVSEHLEALVQSSESNAEHMRLLLETEQASAAKPSSDVDFTPLTDRLNRIHASLERQTERRDPSPGIGDAKFIMSALSSHLSKIQAVTEQNALHVKSLREKHSATGEKMHIAISQTSDQVRSLSEFQSQTDARFEATNGQVRELMAGQREMVDAMRELAKSIIAQNKGACDHVVIPPPRKVGRKVVGFVYDAKDGPA